MSRLLKIGRAAEYLGISIQTLRRWEKEGKLVSENPGCKGETRYYSEAKLFKHSHTKTEINLTIAYARVSSKDQKEDLIRQEQLLSNYCINHGWTYEVISDLGSGMNYHKKGLRRLIDLILSCKIRRLVISHKDRLLRFGSELIFTLCEMKEIEVVIVNQGHDTSFEEELTKDVLEIMTVFSARLYGSRSHKNKKLIEAAKLLSGASV